MEKNIKFITEEKGIKVYHYSFNGDNIFILQDSNKEIVFQGENTTLNQFEESEEYQQVCDFFGKNNI